MPFPLCLAEGDVPSLWDAPCLVSLNWKVWVHRLWAQAELVIFDSSIFMRLLALMRYPVVLKCASPFRKGGAGLSYPASSPVTALAISLNPSLVRLSALFAKREQHALALSWLRVY